METKVFVGSLDDLKSAASADVLIDCSAMDPKEFRSLWSVAKLDQKVRVFVNPPEKSMFPTALPKSRQYLAWDEVPKVWNAWVKRHRLEVVRIKPMTTEALSKILSAGVKHLRFTPTAIEVLIASLGSNTDGVVHKGSVNGILIQLMLNYPKPKVLDVEDLAVVLGGEQYKLASRIVNSLGKPESLALAAKIPSEGDAVRLMHYIERFVANRNSTWLLALKTCRYGADALRYEYKVACILFVMTVLSTCNLQTSRSKKVTSSSEDSIDLMLDLYQLSGIPSLDCGNTKAS